MNWKSLPVGFRAFVAATLFLVLGFLTLWFTKTMLNMQQDVVLVSILFVPVLVYLILSGKLSEIRAGGLSATFIQVTRKPLLDKDDKNAEQVDVEQIAIVMKGRPADLQQMLQNVGNSMYPVLTVTLGKAGYDTRELLNYLKALSQHRNFKFLVILREDEEVFAYISGWRVMQILEIDQIEQSQDSFVMAINQGRTKKLMSYGLIKKTVGTKDTNIDALKMMTEMKMDALIVTDDDGKLKGVVEREQVLSKLMLAMAEPVS
jgi:CBS domain-containing protein